MDFFLAKCKAHHLKITPQRIAVYKALKQSGDHPSADTVHKEIKKQFPNISLDTVNRTLLTFSQIHLIDIVEGQGDPRRFESNLDDHHHFYCLGCNRIFDIFDDQLNRINVPETVKKNFTVTGKRLCIKGFCKECRPLENKT